MSEGQRAAWDKKYAAQGALWSRDHEVWFEVEEGSRVLDLGSGSGKSCASLCGEVVAADFSMAALRLVDDPSRKMAKVCCDAARLPFSDSSFDFVRASFILGHMGAAERKSAICEISRVLKIGGNLALEVFSTSDARNAMKKERRGGNKTNREGIIHHYFDREEVEELLTSFEVRFIEEVAWSQRIGPKKSMRRSIIRALALKPKSISKVK